MTAIPPPEQGPGPVRWAAGVNPATDVSGAQPRVSNYVKKTTAGDTALTLGQAAKADSLPVVLPSDDRITKFVQVKAQAVTASTPYDAYTPTTGKKFVILGYDLGLSVAGSILFEDTTGVEVLRTGTMAANAGKASGPMGDGVTSAAVNNHLFLDVTASGTVNGWIGIREV